MQKKKLISDIKKLLQAFSKLSGHHHTILLNEHE